MTDFLQTRAASLALDDGAVIACRAAPVPSPAPVLEKARVSPWVVRWPPFRAEPEMRLFCFPHAGGGAATYRRWQNQLPAFIELCAIQLPGHGHRLREPVLNSLQAIVDTLHGELMPLLDRPFAFFGHSMGAIIAAEVCRSLAGQAGPLPQQLFLSGRRPPWLPDPQAPLRQLSDEAFVDEINRRYGGIPPEIAAEPEVLALLLPALRADIAALETHRPSATEPIDCPITVIGGSEDPLTPRAHLDAWRHETRREFALRLFPGGHFYLDDCREALVPEIARTLVSRLQAIRQETLR
jgi:medium-chain acyl-[acyl-carrier-protein] hydrolase